MNNNTRVKKLIDELLTDPAKFNKRGRAYQMLQCYFRGVPVETLRPLLHHHNNFVRRSAMFVASEIAYGAKCLIREIVPLIHDPDPHTQWYALETVMVCSTDTEVDLFLCIIDELENDDGPMRRLAMSLISNANSLQLETGYRLTQPTHPLEKIHKAGLLVLCKGDSIDEHEVSKMLENSVPLTRKYGAIAAKRLFGKFPKLLEDAVSSLDPDISQFAKERIKVLLL